MKRVGRRPGHAETRSQIVEAARASFIEDGYADASLRGIARRAGVDPALVHHYFQGKPELFIEAMGMPMDPRAVKAAASGEAAPGAAASPDARSREDAEEAAARDTARGFSGARLVEEFLSQWDTGQAGEPGTSFVAVAQAVCASPKAADSMREFLEDRLWSDTGQGGTATSGGGPSTADADSMRRRSLVGSQLVGLAWARYVLRVEPLASAEPAEIARWVGPVIDRYASGDLSQLV